MSKTQSSVGVTQPQPDEQEYSDIEQFIENWKLPQRSHRAALHIYEDCDRLQCRTGSLVKKSPAVYPYGYTDVCEYCLEEYRSEREHEVLTTSEKTEFSSNE